MNAKQIAEQIAEQLGAGGPREADLQDGAGWEITAYDAEADRFVEVTVRDVSRPAPLTPNLG